MKNIIAFLLLLAFASTGCKTLTPERYQSKVVITILPGQKKYEARIRLYRGAPVEDDSNLVASPSIKFIAGKPARISVDNQSEVFSAEVFIPDKGPDPLCLCKMVLTRDGKTVYEKNIIVRPEPTGLGVN